MSYHWIYLYFLVCVRVRPCTCAILMHIIAYRRIMRVEEEHEHSAFFPMNGMFIEEMYIYRLNLIFKFKIIWQLLSEKVKVALAGNNQSHQTTFVWAFRLKK